MPEIENPAPQARLHFKVLGCVQGVGFRPFVLNLAQSLDLCGWVSNSPQGVDIEVEGDPDHLAAFRRELVTARPAPAHIERVEVSAQNPEGDARFEIRPSAHNGRQSTLILPDLATCPQCLAELWDPADRRYRYPFINCTHCGPRFTIITGLPYDRPRTTMAGFQLCPECRREYENPYDRRFHAQPVACPACGPHLSLWDPKGRLLCERDAALLAAADEIRAGRIVAVKGLGGFQLLVNAQDEAAVSRLRLRKHREAKPLAVMFPDLVSTRRVCSVSAAEEAQLLSSEAPIVLLDRLNASDDAVAPAVAPGFRTLGVMLPYTPLHHLLLQALRLPVVATSGNAAEEPICTDEFDAVTRLSHIADLFLVHNRPIARQADDPVVRVISGRPMVLRRGRGMAPRAVGSLAAEVPSVLAVGADLKNCPAQSYGPHLLAGQHVGDLEHPLAFESFSRVIADLNLLLGRRPERIACDLHPDYHSTRWAARQRLPVHRVQHHHAHVVSCMVDNGLEGTVLGISWDGTGYGSDGTIWGGEFLLADRSSFSRYAHLRSFALPGGDRAARDGRLCALGLLYELYGADAFEAMPRALADSFSAEERRVLPVALQRGLGVHRTTSAGRLFDGVAALLDVQRLSRFEGEAACALETCAVDWADTVTEFPQVPDEAGSLSLDWGPLISDLLRDVSGDHEAGALARRFHASLAGAMVAVAERAQQNRVVLTGGCFQNRLLHELAAAGLERAGFTVYRHRRVPPNDGGIAVGQLAVACAATPPRST
jgi:hydrogenase maturation protein HypF